MPRGGPYRLRVSANGFVPVERQVLVDGPTTVEIDLESAQGRAVSAEIPDRYWVVEAREVGAAWQRILWQDDRVRISHRETRGEFLAVLAPGTYEFRMVSDRHAPAVLAPTRVEPGTEPFVLRFPLAAGGALSGSLRTRGGDTASLLLHVFRRQDDGSYRRLEEKETRGEDGAKG